MEEYRWQEWTTYVLSKCPVWIFFVFSLISRYLPNSLNGILACSILKFYLFDTMKKKTTRKYFLRSEKGVSKHRPQMATTTSDHDPRPEKLGSSSFRSFSTIELFWIQIFFFHFNGSLFCMTSWPRTSRCAARVQTQIKKRIK